MDNDLISRSALIKWFSPYMHEDEAIPSDVVIGDIKAAPAVDAVEVVRCKDCIHYEKNMLYSECWHKIGMINVYDDCYCSRGERRTE